jgi:hypothetical protein
MFVLVGRSLRKNAYMSVLALLGFEVFKGRRPGDHLARLGSARDSPSHSTPPSGFDKYIIVLMPTGPA